MADARLAKGLALLDALETFLEEMSDALYDEAFPRAEEMHNPGFDPDAAIPALRKLLAGQEVPPEEDPLEHANMHCAFVADVSHDNRNDDLCEVLHKQPFAHRKAYLAREVPQDPILYVVISNVEADRFVGRRVLEPEAMPAELRDELYKCAGACFRDRRAIGVPDDIIRRLESEELLGAAKTIDRKHKSLVFIGSRFDVRGLKRARQHNKF